MLNEYMHVNKTFLKEIALKLLVEEHVLIIKFIMCKKTPIKSVKKHLRD